MRLIGNHFPPIPTLFSPNPACKSGKSSVFVSRLGGTCFCDSSQFIYLYYILQIYIYICITYILSYIIGFIAIGHQAHILCTNCVGSVMLIVHRTSSDCDSQKQSDYGSLSNQQRLTCLLCINQLHNIYIINSYSICPTASPLCLHLEYGPNSVFDLVHILSVSPSLYKCCLCQSVQVHIYVPFK